MEVTGRGKKKKTTSVKLFLMLESKPKLDIRRNLFSVHWNKLPREVEELPCLDAFMKNVDVELRGMI